MFGRLHGTWFTDNSPAPPNLQTENESHSTTSSRLSGISALNGGDHLPSPSSVFTVNSDSLPTEKVVIPPFFVPPRRVAANDAPNDDLNRRLHDALQRDILVDAPRMPLCPSSHVPDSLMPQSTPIAPKEHASSSGGVSPSSAPHSQGAQAHIVSRSPSPQVDLEFQRTCSALWSSSAQASFRAMVKGPNYTNRYRLSPSKSRRLISCLQNPDLEPINADGSKDHHIRYQAANWILRDGKLYRKADGKAGVGLRRHLDDHEVWYVLTAEHVRNGHLGRDRLRKVLERRYIGYTLQEIMFVLRECKRCNSRERSSADATIDQPPSSDGAGLPENPLGNHVPRTNAGKAAALTKGTPSTKRQSSNFMYF